MYCLLITRELSRGGSNRNAEREYFYGYAVGRDLFAQVRMAAFNASAARLLL
jgi:hypothetical protein